MENLFSQEMFIFFIMVSNYLIALCMLFFALDCFISLLSKNNLQSKFTYVRQCFWIFVIQLISFYDLAYNSRDWTYVTLYIAIQIFLLIVLVLTPSVYRKINYTLFAIMCMLLSIGLIMISRLSTDKAIRQFEIICVAYTLCMFIPLLITKTNLLPKLKWIFSVIGAVLLGIVCFLGETTYGSKLSFSIGEFSFQPSELVKILFVLFIAGALSESTNLIRILITSSIAGLHIILLVFSTDLGSALIFFVTFLAMLFVASKKYLYLLSGVLGGCLAAILAFYLFSHIQTRVLAWTDPWAYIDSKGYQITQSLFAIGTGSWFGMGLYKGVPDDIPFVEVDFIFSSICEEMGTVVGMLLLLIILACFMLMIKIALNCNNKFYRLTAFGLSVLYIFQVFLTVGGGIKFIPLTGVTLPLISYGGSSVASVMLMFFILFGIHITTQKAAPIEEALHDFDFAQNEIQQSEEEYNEEIDNESIKSE